MSSRNPAARESSWPIEHRQTDRARTWAGAVVLAIVELAITLVVSAPAHAQAENGWLGKRVVPKEPGFRLRIGTQSIDPGKFAIYRVEEHDGHWLRLKVPGEGIRGWAPARDVLPVEKAIVYFTNYIRTHPGDSYGYSIRAFLRREEKQLDIALHDNDEAIRLDPSNALAYVDRGLTRDARKEYDRAIDDYSEAIRLDPDLACAYSNRGADWGDERDYEKAIADFSRAIRLDPMMALCRSNRGLAWYYKGEYDKAITDCTEAIRLDAELAAAHFNRGLARYCKRDYEKSIADFSRAIDLDPAYAFAYSNRAWIWATCTDARFRDGPKAVESATKACDLSRWEQAVPISVLAAAYAEAGDFEKAVRSQAQANELRAESEDMKGGEERLELYKEKKPYRDIR